ncbi:MAG: O-antigen ligase family protein [Clostridia bacterium]|nr:O-antigen ligase family protein [Clostridia bacterium]
MTNELNVGRKSTAEFLFALYCFAFAFAKPVTTAVGGLSTLVLLGVALVILLVYIFTNIGDLNFLNLLKFIAFFLLMAAFFGFNVLFAGNAVVYAHIYNFIIYGLIPIFLLINVRDYARVLKYWCYIGMIQGCMFLIDPFVGYQWSGGYMQLGFNHLLPAFAASVVIWLYYEKKWGLVPTAVFFVDMLLNTNKGSPVTAVIFFILFFLMMRKLKYNKKATGAILGIAAVAGLVVLFRFQLFELAVDLAELLGVNSYSLNTFREMLYKSPDRIFSIRTDIWNMALEAFKESPILGLGIGTFEHDFGKYPHNVMIEVLSSSGVFAFIFFCAMIVVSALSIKRASAEKRVLMFTFLILWIVPMQISLSLWNYPIFWIYWGIFLYNTDTPKTLVDVTDKTSTSEEK